MDVISVGKIKNVTRRFVWMTMAMLNPSPTFARQTNTWWNNLSHSNLFPLLLVIVRNSTRVSTVIPFRWGPLPVFGPTSGFGPIPSFGSTSGFWAHLWFGPTSGLSLLLVQLVSCVILDNMHFWIVLENNRFLEATLRYAIFGILLEVMYALFWGM